MPGIAERLKAAAQSINQSKLGKWLDSHPVDRMNQSVADKVAPSTTPIAVDRPDLHKAIQAVQTKTKAPVRFAYEATYVPRKATETGLQATGVTQSPEEKKDAYIQAQRGLMDQLKLEAEQARIAELRHQLTSNN